MTNFNIYGGTPVTEIPRSSDDPVIGDTFKSTYKDDFDPGDNYHRVLFNSGKALQARELTQLQTIIQAEIARFGNNIFKEGAAVNPGGPTVVQYDYVTITTDLDDEAYEALKGGQAYGNTSKVFADVLEVIPADSITGDPTTLYIRYTDTGQFTGDPLSSPTFLAGDTLTVSQIGEGGDIDLDVGLGVATGKGTVVSNAAGDFFVAGHFVYADPQSIVMDKYSPTPTGAVGFITIQDIVTVADTDALYDNQGTQPNFTAPGADRYRIRLQLILEADTVAEDNFVYYCNVKNGAIIDQVEGDDQYNKIADMVAERTKDESGNYIVTPFDLAVQDNADTTLLNYNISAGLAYVNGYRVRRNDVDEALLVEKPKSSTTIQNQSIAVEYGNYVIFALMDTLPQYGSLVGNTGLPDIKSLSAYSLYAGEEVIGACRIKGVYFNRFSKLLGEAHLMDITMLPEKKFGDITKIGTDDLSLELNVIKQGTMPMLRQTDQNCALFPLPIPRARSVDDVVTEVQRQFYATAKDGVLSVEAGKQESLVNTSQWIVGKVGEAGYFSTDIEVKQRTAIIYNLEAQGNTRLDFPAGNYVIYAMVQKGQDNRRTKTLVTRTESLTTQLDEATGTYFAALPAADIYSLDNVTIPTYPERGSIRTAFTLDNGQRDNFYALGKIMLNAGSVYGDGPLNIDVVFKHFEHGAGDFFCVNSYMSDIPIETEKCEDLLDINPPPVDESIPLEEGKLRYADIPSYTQSNGVTVKLAQVLDFRSVKGTPLVDSDGAQTSPFVVDNSFASELPKSGTSVTADVTYFHSRHDLISIDETSEITVLLGEESLNPKPPATPEGQLALWNIYLPPNTLDAREAVTQRVEARHYTMRDIGGLEDRITRLQTTVALSLLESKAEAWNTYDENGLTRYKSGYLVDNFADYGRTDTQDRSLRSAIDIQQLMVRPMFFDANLGLKYLPQNQDKYQYTEGDGVVLKGDNLYIKYDSMPAINQLMASGFENINPFHVIITQGLVQLSPASDNWNMVWQHDAGSNAGWLGDAADTIDENGLPIWNAAEWAWHGETPNISTNGGWGGNQLAIGESTGRTERWGTRANTRLTTRTRVADKVVNMTDWFKVCRARKIFFRANGLRPNSVFYPFFDKVNVSQWCRMEEAWTSAAVSYDDYGNNFRQSTEHPDGTTSLRSDANGDIIGSFYLPNNATQRFPIGTNTFALLDIGPDEYFPNQAVSSAMTPFPTSGVLTSRQAQYITTVRVWDPLAQSFHIDPDGNGMFLTEVDVFFQSKAIQLDTAGDAGPLPPGVRMEIRPLVNGQPSSEEIYGWVKLPASSIKVLDNEDPTLEEVRTLPTKFTFDEPIYLEPNKGYAIVLLADSIAYNVYTSETGEFQLGSTFNRIRTQPSLGSLFKSQNGITWEPSQKQDMMFRAYAAKFNTGETKVTLVNKSLPVKYLPSNPFFVEEGSFDKIYVKHINSGLSVGDIVHISREQASTPELTLEMYASDTYNGLDWTAINDEARDGAGDVTTADTGHAVVDADGSGYSFMVYSGTATAGIFGGTGKTATENRVMDIVRPEINTLLVPETTVSYSGKFTNEETGAIAANTTSVDNREWNLFDQPQVIKADEDSAGNGVDVSSATIEITLSTTDSAVSPVIDLQTASLTTVHNHIDDQENGDTPLFSVEETAPGGGSGMSRHIVIPVELEMDAVGLSVLLGVNRPSVCNLDLYYRVTGDDGQDLAEVSWVKAETVNPMAADDDPDVWKEYEYLIGGSGSSSDQLPEFHKFQVKMVFRSTLSTYVPRVRDLRIIALAV